MPERTTMALGAAAAIGAVGTMNAFCTAPLSGSATQVRPSLRATAAAAAASAQPSATATGTSTVALAAGAAIAAVATASARKRGSVKMPNGRAVAVERGSAVAMQATKRVLVMGGTRFIGCYLVAKLREQGHEVVVCNRGKTNGGMPEPLPGMTEEEHKKMLEGVTLCKADRGDTEAFKQAIIDAGKFDIVYDNNARKLDQVVPLAEAVLATGGVEQFVFMSSAGVYGPTDVLPLNEATPGDPKSRHAAKLECELMLNEKGFNWTSIRPVYIYGPLNYNPVERFFFDRVARGRPICVPFGGKFITQLGHCEDLADFMVKIIGNPKVKGQVYNISGEEFVTFDGMAKECARAAGKPEPKIVHYDAKAIKPPEDFPKAFPFRGMHFFAGIDKAKADVPDWSPKYSLFDGLKSSYEKDYVGRGFDKKEVDYRTDDLILKETGNLESA